jgi:hypothetical protein
MSTTRRIIITTAAAILAGVAAGAPIATARPPDDPASAANRAPTTVYSRPEKSVILVAAPYAAQLTDTATAPPAVVRVQLPPTGFDWGDAGIGAAGGLALAMLGLGGGLVITHRRPRRTSHTTTLPN